jgi:hypothetical protein
MIQWSYVLFEKVLLPVFHVRSHLHVRFRVRIRVRFAAKSVWQVNFYKQFFSAMCSQTIVMGVR